MASGRQLVALVAACTFVAMLSPSAAGKPNPKYRKEEYLELDYSLKSVANAPGSNAFFILPPLAGFADTVEATNFFGATGVFDFELYPSGKTSPVVANMRGIGTVTINDTANLGTEIIFTTVFSEASDYFGSTLCYRGFSYFFHKPNEFCIVGGTGKFRLARGWAEFPATRVSDFVFSLNLTSYVYYYN